MSSWPPDEGQAPRRTVPAPPPDRTRSSVPPPLPPVAEEEELPGTWQGYGSLDPDRDQAAPDRGAIPDPTAFADPAPDPATRPYGATPSYDDPERFASPPPQSAAAGGGAADAYPRYGAADPGQYGAADQGAAGYGATAYDAADTYGYDYGQPGGVLDSPDGYGYDDADYGDEPPYAAAAGAEGAVDDGSRRGRRHARQRSRALAREERWQRHRFAVPYRTDGPKLTFGVLWFLLIVGAILYSPLFVAALAAGVAGLAGLQIGYAWFPRHNPTRLWAAAGAFISGLMGALGPIGVVAAAVVGLVISFAYAVANPSRSQSMMALAEVAMRAIVPAGVAAASLAALADIGIGAALALVGLVSAYEVGDFLVGSGSMNAVEGPLSGFVSLAAVVFILWVVTPDPFTSSSIVLFGVLTGVGCVIGQIFASAILPRGAAWAPALRRLDSYLVVAPIWVLLLGSVDATTL
ncbi:MAG: hypothetical protein AAF962_19065 [Actinomycetota bacterium]